MSAKPAGGAFLPAVRARTGGMLEGVGGELVGWCVVVEEMSQRCRVKVVVVVGI